MKKNIMKLGVVCAVCCGFAAQAQSPSSGSSGSSSGSSSSDPLKSTDATGSRPASGSSAIYSSGPASSSWGVAGRPGHQQSIRASQLYGSQVTSSSGQALGTLDDVIINPASGRVDLAILSVTEGAASSTDYPLETAKNKEKTPRSTGTLGSKQVAVPWMLLRVSPASATSVAGSDSMTQMTFVFSGDHTKLHTAPAFSLSTDLSQAGWRQSVYAHYGLTAGAAMGGAGSTPGGSSTGSSSDDDSSKSNPDSSKTSPPDQSPPGDKPPR